MKIYVWGIGSWAVKAKDDGEKAASRCLREKMWQMPGTGSLAAASLHTALSSRGWAEASWFYCLVAWLCLACEGSWKWRTSAQLWKWAAASPGEGCDTRLIVPSRQPLESPLWTSEMLTVACRVAWLWLRVTSRHENRQGVLTFWRMYKNAGWLQRGGVISFLLPRSVLVRGNSLLPLSLFSVCVCEAYAASMLKSFN